MWCCTKHKEKGSACYIDIDLEAETCWFILTQWLNKLRMVLRSLTFKLGQVGPLKTQSLTCSYHSWVSCSVWKENSSSASCVKKIVVHHGIFFRFTTEYRVTSNYEVCSAPLPWIPLHMSLIRGSSQVITHLNSHRPKLETWKRLGKQSSEPAAPASKPFMIHDKRAPEQTCWYLGHHCLSLAQATRQRVYPYRSKYLNTVQ